MTLSFTESVVDAAVALIWFEALGWAVKNGFEIVAEPAAEQIIEGNA